MRPICASRHPHVLEMSSHKISWHVLKCYFIKMSLVLNTWYLSASVVNKLTITISVQLLICSVIHLKLIIDVVIFNS